MMVGYILALFGFRLDVCDQGRYKQLHVFTFVISYEL